MIKGAGLLQETGEGLPGWGASLAQVAGERGLIQRSKKIGPHNKETRRTDFFLNRGENWIFFQTQNVWRG